MPEDQNGDLETRFSTFLQPIRDLTKNWDVDIAHHLEDYLEALSNIKVTFDGGLTTMNFAEAALVIQGSVCVYSKKVEYLYSLVCQVLELLASKKKQNKASKDDNDNDDDIMNDGNEDEEFLSLDDIQEHKAIVIKEDELGHKAVQPVPRMPLSLIPLEEGEKGDDPLLSKTGEVLASRKDFRLNTCSVHTSGTLLLDMSHMYLLLKSLQGGEETIATMEALSTIPEGDTEMINACEAVNNKTPECVADIGENISSEDHDDQFDPIADEVDGAPAAEDSIISKQAESEERVLRRSERKRVQIDIPKPVVDPWKCLDPHDAGTAVERKCKKGKNYSIPKTIETETGGKKKRKRTKAEIKLPPLYEFTNKIYMNTSKMTKAQRRELEFEELDRLYWEELKRRQVILRNSRKKLANVFEDDVNEEEVEHESDADVDDVVNDDVDDVGLSSTPPLIDDKLFDAIDQAHYPDMEFPMEEQAHSELDAVDQGVFVTDYEELVKQHVDHYLASAQEYAQITELSKRVAEWEEKVIPRLEEEDTHEPFDINRYGSMVLDNLHKGVSSPFQRVVTNKPTYEVCRIFLATLMLANTCNVEIQNKDSNVLSMDSFKLSLLTTKRHFEQLEEYQAPSIAGKS